MKLLLIKLAWPVVRSFEAICIAVAVMKLAARKIDPVSERRWYIVRGGDEGR